MNARQMRRSRKNVRRRRWMRGPIGRVDGEYIDEAGDIVTVGPDGDLHIEGATRFTGTTVKYDKAEHRRKAMTRES